MKPIGSTFIKTGEFPYIAPALQALAEPVESLKLDPRNAVSHDEFNRRHVRFMLEDFGQQLPIVANRETRVVIKGNCTLEQTKDLGRTHIAVVWVDWDDEASVDFALRDNKVGQLSNWNYDVVSPLLQQLHSMEHDMERMPWNNAEMESLLEAVWVPPLVKEDCALTTRTEFESELEEKDVREEVLNTPAPAAAPKQLAPEDDASRAKPIIVTPGQRETIERAIEKVRDMNDDKTLTEGRCVELALADWLAGV